QVALVELVEQQRADAVQQRVVLQHAGEDAFGDDLDAGTRGDPVLEADAVADGLADRLAELPRHELGGTARGDAARPSSMVLMGGPVDAGACPTLPVNLSNSKPLSWFENNVIATVPGCYPGAGRRV
ncbi:hypothetical protein JZU48_01565, partial [bacterium]|nr:hypothetical protein [bacterium]